VLALDRRSMWVTAQRNVAEQLERDVSQLEPLGDAVRSGHVVRTAVPLTWAA